MFDHISIGVRGFEPMAAFYDAVLMPLGLSRIISWEPTPEHPFVSAGYGPAGNEPMFHLEQRPNAASAGAGFHLCFGAPSRAAVREFYRAGLLLGASDSGAPGLREHYGSDYYAAFLTDPEGWRIEAMTFDREP